jgi:hypothetical protein
MKDAHPILGIVLFALLFLQAPFGYMHHLGYKRVGGRTFWSYLHLWIGRVAITFGMVNGALGFKLSNNTNLGLLVYAIIAAIIWIVYVLSVIIGERRRARARATMKPDAEDMVQQHQSPNFPGPPPAVPTTMGNIRMDSARRSSSGRRLSGAEDISPEQSTNDRSPRISRNRTLSGSRRSRRISAVSEELAGEIAQRESFPPGYSVPPPPEGFYGRASHH